MYDSKCRRQNDHRSPDLAHRSIREWPRSSHRRQRLLL